MPAVTIVDANIPLAGAVVVIGAYAAHGSGATGSKAGGSTSTNPRLADGADLLGSTLLALLLAAYVCAGGTGQPEEVVKIPTLGLGAASMVVITGLGPDSSASPADAANTTRVSARIENVRRGIASAIRALSTQERVVIALSDPAIEPAQMVDAIAAGVLLGHYRFRTYKSKPARRGLRTAQIVVDTADRSVRAGLRRATVLANAINQARDWVNMPPNDLYPDAYADQLAGIGAIAGVTVDCLAEDDLRREGYRAMLAVGGGSSHGPRLVRLSYAPVRPRARIAIVGQGTTFNAGGLNLKTAQMSWTKSDMAGAAAAAAAVVVAARLKLPVEIIATLPLVENLPSATSYRPSDILTLRGGRTVEVGDTDASGRLVLAEAIGRAVEDEPDYLLEVSTLSAAQRVALGPRVIAAMGEPGLRDRVVAAGRAQGEELWPMPLPSQLRQALESNVADLGNVAPDRWGAMLVAGHFLADFVPAGMPWVHLDITGPAWNSGGAHGYTANGGTGAAITTLLASIEAIAADR